MQWNVMNIIALYTERKEEGAAGPRNKGVPQFFPLNRIDNEGHRQQEQEDIVSQRVFTGNNEQKFSREHRQRIPASAF
jgi:hypothetical protein